jgi:hypothetical protein
MLRFRLLCYSKYSLRTEELTTRFRDNAAPESGTLMRLALQLGISEVPLETGAVALIDALGFRGIWDRHPPEEVLSELKQMQSWMEERVRFQFSSQPHMQCKVAFLSDTAAVSMALPTTTESREALSVIYLCDVLSWILNRSLRSRVPLAYRGAVAIGGPAIDEAAAAHERAQAATIWLTPNARDAVGAWLRTQPNNTHLVKFSVPLKLGESFRTYTVSPLEQAGGEDDANFLANKLLDTFTGGTVEVAMKRQNTENHLRACYHKRGYRFPEGFTKIF